ncbi:MAG: hypothetical protein K2X69_02910 [Silvanigrellaceae bacterium]|nr:hypothetical protein [Silvanigrellaceae bacterium]
MVDFVKSDTGDFYGKITNKTKNLIVGSGDEIGEYLKSFIGKYIGIKPGDVNNETIISFPSKYNNIEGVDKKMEKETGFVEGLRIDLQKSRVFNGKIYATIQVQFGTGMIPPKGGAYCGALVQTEQEFTAENINEALRKSLNDLSYFYLNP